VPDDLVITSAANPRLRALVGLRRRRMREQTGTTLVEGHEEIALALASSDRSAALLADDLVHDQAHRQSDRERQ